MGVNLKYLSRVIVFILGMVKLHRALSVFFRVFTTYKTQCIV